MALKLAPVFRGYAEVNQSNEGKTMEVMTLTSLASEGEKGGLFFYQVYKRQLAEGSPRVFHFSVSPTSMTSINAESTSNKRPPAVALFALFKQDIEFASKVSFTIEVLNPSFTFHNLEWRT